MSYQIDELAAFHFYSQFMYALTLPVKNDYTTHSHK